MLHTGLTNKLPTESFAPHANEKASSEKAFTAENTVKKQYMITRRLHVQITSSLKELATGKSLDTWVPLHGKADKVFGINDIFQVETDEATSSQMLQHAILHRVSFFEQKNEFPVNLGIRMSCIPNDEVTCNGEQFAITSFANSHSTAECNVFCADMDCTESAQWRSEYPLYNSTNLETQGVLIVNGAPYVFVHQDHPVIQVLRINRELINNDIDKQQKIDNEWFKVMRTVMNTCCAELRQRVLNKVSARDLNQFSVQICRLGQVGNWTKQDDDSITKCLPHDVIVRGDVKEIEEHVNVMLKRRFSYSARIEVQYEVHA